MTALNEDADVFHNETSSRRHQFTRVIVATVSLVCCGAPVGSAAQDEAFLSWASESLHPIVSTELDASTSDLRAIGEMISDARIVTLGEGVHGAAEPLAFRNRLFRYLVEELGFTTIAIESGTVESRAINEYVHAGSGEIADVVAQGISWTMDDFPQNTSLVRWMRAYNLDRPDESKLNFFGFDVPGSPGNRSAVRGIDTAINEAIAFVQRVDETSANALNIRLERYLPLSLRKYGQLPQPDRDQLTGVVADLVAVIKRREWAYVEATSQTEYDWAYIAAVGARQIDDYLRFLPLGWMPDDGFAWAKEAAIHRDRAMMDNIEWIMDQLGDDDRILIFASLGHLASVPTELPDGEQVGAGAYLKRRYGSDMLTIGNILSDGEIGNCLRGPRLTLEAPPESSLSHLFARLRIPQFVLDLRAPPPDARAMFSQKSALWNGFIEWSAVVTDAFDIAYFSGPVTPACSERGG